MEERGFENIDLADIKPIDETIREEWGENAAYDLTCMLHGLLKPLCREAGFYFDRTEEQRFCLKLVIAQWTRGIAGFDHRPAQHFLQDAENLVRLNRIAGSLKELWDWYDSLPTIGAR